MSDSVWKNTGWCTALMGVLFVGTIRYVIKYKDIIQIA